MIDTTFTVHPSCAYEFFIVDGAAAVVCAIPLGAPVVLRDSGLAIWKVISQKPVSVDDVVCELGFEEFTESRTIHEETRSFLSLLARAGILVVAAGDAES